MVHITDIIKIVLLVWYVCLDLSTIWFILQQIIFVGCRLIL